MVESENLCKTFNVSSAGTAPWQGIPVMMELTSNLLGTLSPKQIDGKLFSVFTVFDCYNPYELVQRASIPVE